METEHAMGLLLAEFQRCQLTWTELDRREHERRVWRWVDLYGTRRARGGRRRSGVRAVAEAERVSTGTSLVVPCRNPASNKWNAVGTAFRCQGKPSRRRRRGSNR